MELDQKIFHINPSEYTDRLCAFIRETMTTLNREGVLVPLSGGLDSSTVLLLCARAVGPENVTALLLPERQGNPEAVKYASLIASQYNIKTITRNISPLLARLGTYNFALALVPFRSVQDWAARRYLKTGAENPMLQLVSGTASPFQRKGFARYNSKHRVRAVVTYLIAEERNNLVTGCAHKSEDMLGLFVKFGVDDSADIMPLKNLYRTQILQLAAYLGVPDEIINRTPNPDIIPGVSDKYMDVLGLSADTLDLLVYGIENDMDNSEIASQLNLPVEKVRQIRELVYHTRHMRNPSQSVDWEQQSER